MQFLLDKSHQSPLYEQARGQLLAALHTGILKAGDRLPSVRQVARRNALNIKTAFSIYRRLSAEGYIDLRRGSGAYVPEIDAPDLEVAYDLSLYKLLKSNLAEAGRLNIGPREYSDLVRSFIKKPNLESVRVTVIECNEEQINVFAHEISKRLNVRVFPLLLDRLESADRQTSRELARTDIFATTDFHFKRVKELTARYQRKLLQLRLNPAFIPTIIAAASDGPVLMIVSDTDYFPAFSRSLLDLGTPPKLVERISAVACSDLARVRALAAQARSVYITPICDSRVRKIIPPQVRELKFDTVLSPEALETLEALLLFSSRQLSLKR